MLEANSATDCVGVIAWMHTFSPAKMWISGLDALNKPLLHLHTQAGMALPWSTIDMDFMNLNQAAHGDREFGYIQTRLGVPRKTVAGHVDSPVVAERVGVGAGRAGPPRAATAAAGAIRRQHAQRRGHRGRQGRGPAPLRGLGEHLWRERPRGGRRRRRRRRRRQAGHRVRRHLPRRARAAARRRPARVAALRRPHRARPAHLPGRGRLRRVHHQLRGPRRPAPAARARGPAADGRRLRVRRRGRLEDLGAAARA